MLAQGAVGGEPLERPTVAVQVFRVDLTLEAALPR